MTYQNGKIYTIRCKNDENLIYVGSTIQPLSLRFSNHKCDSQRRSSLLYQEIGNKWDDLYIELYKNFPCETREELFREEGNIIRSIGTLNKQIAGRTQKERYQETIEDKKAYDIKYHARYDSIFYETKKDVINHKRRQKVACECGFMSNKANLYKHKQSSNHFSRKEQIEKEKIGV